MAFNTQYELRDHTFHNLGHQCGGELGPQSKMWCQAYDRLPQSLETPGMACD